MKIFRRRNMEYMLWGGGEGGREDVGAVKDDWKGTETITIT